MPGKIFSVAQQKGGAGKTTLAAHLAIAFADLGKSVAVGKGDGKVRSQARLVGAQDAGCLLRRHGPLYKGAMAAGKAYPRPNPSPSPAHHGRDFRK